VGLIILPSELDQRKTFHALHVQPEIRTGIIRGHIDPVLIAANCLTQAKRLGCEEIVVGLEGVLPRRYSIKSVEEAIAKNPLKFTGWIPRLLHTQEERRRDLMVRRRMQGKPGGIQPL